jgi:hypothetical protein
VQSTAVAEAFPFSLVRGGPLSDVLYRVRLARDDRRDVARESFACVALTWVPIIALALLEHAVNGRWDPLLRDFALHARLLVAIPLLFVSDEALHVLTGHCVDQFFRGGFAEDEAAARGVVARSERLRDRRAPELVLFALVVLESQVVFWGGPRQWQPFFSAPAVYEHTWVAGWYALVGLPVTQFLMARWTWRWIIWTQMLWALSGLGLRLTPLHPDRRGGVSFLSEPVVGFAPALAAFSSIQAGGWATKLTTAGGSFKDFAGPFGAVVVLAAIVAVAPIATWVLPLAHVRREGRLTYGVFAADYVRHFERKWLDGGSSADTDPLGTSDIQSLADLGGSFDAVQGMRIVPIDAATAVTVLVAVAVPLVPLALREMSAADILRRVISVGIGGGAG